MAAEPFAADPDLLRQSAQRLRALQSRVQAMSSTVDQLATRYPEAAGDGDFKESYDKNYVPAAAAAKEFMAALSTSVEEVAADTSTIARDFEDTEDTATTESRHRG